MGRESQLNGESLSALVCSVCLAFPLYCSQKHQSGLPLCSRRKGLNLRESYHNPARLTEVRPSRSDTQTETTKTKTDNIFVRTFGSEAPYRRQELLTRMTKEGVGERAFLAGLAVVARPPMAHPVQMHSHCQRQVSGA